MRIVARQVEIFVLKREQVLYLRIQFHAWKRTGFARKLQAHLLQVVQVDVRVAQGMDEIARTEACHLRHHLKQKRIRSDIERDAQEDVRAPLVQLEAQPPVCHIELEEGMARRQVHVLQIGHVPRAHDDAPRIRIMPDRLAAIWSIAPPL